VNNTVSEDVEIKKKGEKEERRKRTTIRGNARKI
jgi:hypothetical protein